MDYALTEAIGTKGTLGLIVLQVDETIEQDFRRLFPDPDVAIYVSRIPSGADLTPETIAQMASELPAAASLLPQAATFDAVAYACTSGTTLIGEDRVTEMVTSHCQATRVTNPLTASIAAAKSLGVSSLGIVSPYIASVAQPVANSFEKAGVTVAQTVSFGEQTEANVARIDPASIFDAACSLGDDVDGVFLSCTNLRTLGIIDALETKLGIPVFSSNQALAWHMARGLAPSAQPSGPGKLLITPPL